jgi:hypothetical protein
MPDHTKASDIPLSRWQRVQQQLWFQGCVISLLPLAAGLFLYSQLPPHPDNLQHVEGFVKDATRNKGTWALVLTNGKTYQGTVFVGLKDGGKLGGRVIYADVWYGKAYRLRTSDTVLLYYDDVYASQWKPAKLYLIAACIGFALSAALASAALRRFLLWVPRPSAKL